MTSSNCYSNESEAFFWPNRDQELYANERQVNAQRQKSYEEKATGDEGEFD